MRLAAVLALLALAGAQAAPSTPGQVIIRPEIPALNTIAPTSGLVGSSVVLTGNNFGPAQENSLVTFNGAPAVTIAWSNTSITALVPPAGTTGPVMVVRGGVSTAGLPFTVIPSPPPTLTSLSVITGPPGTAVTVTGTNFGATQGTSVLTFNGTVATATSWSATSIATTVPVGATTGPVHVVVLGQTSNNLTFTVTVQPVLTSLNLNSGPVGTAVTLTGLHFGAVQNSSLVFFNGVPAAGYSAWSDTSATATVPASATTGLVTILVLGVTSNGLTFTVTSSNDTVAAADCNVGSVAAAVTTAFMASPQKHIVTIPPGHCTWNSNMFLYPNWNGVTIQGAGDTQTFIDATPLGVGGSGNAEQAAINTQSDVARITGIHWICARIDLAGSGWRVDHNTFECHQHDFQVWGTGVKAEATNATNQLTADLKGLIDNNHFIDQRVLDFGYQAESLADHNGSTWWSRPLGLGGDNAMYVEDNDFRFESFENVVDCQSSGAFVFRYNTVADSYIEVHPASGGARGCRKWEIYNDTMTQSTLMVGAPVNIRGGAGVMFNTTWTGTFGDGHGTLVVTRAYTNNAPFLNACDGTSPWDGNLGSGASAGWPCIDQIGRGSDNMGPFNGSPPPYSPPPQSSEPVYFTNNKMNGASMIFAPFNAESAARLVLNRDYFVSDTVMKPGYTPYFYPHPLQGLPAPTLTTLSVTTGPVGTTVTLTGANFRATQAQSTVTFNGVNAVPSAWSATSITVTVPAGATTGQVRVTVGAGVSNGIQFTVT
jgi:hypothetical protein